MWRPESDFARCLLDQMLESHASEIEIVDVRRPIFLAFLEYLYTGYLTVANDDEYVELLVVADRVRGSVGKGIN